MTNQGRPAQPTPLLACLALMAALAALLACGVLPAGSTSAATPTATETASATPTASATTMPMTPTPTPTRVERAASITPSGTKAATSPGTPAASPDPAFDKVRAAVLDHMEATGGSVDGLASALQRSGMELGSLGQGVSSAKPGVVTADFDGDGVDETVVVVEDPSATSIVGRGAVFIVDRPSDRYTIAYDSSTQVGSGGAVSLLSIEDANADSLADLSYFSRSCGAHTCFAEVSVVSYQSGAYVNLAPDVATAYPDLIALRDETGDGRLEIVAHGGTYGSVGAGPQRAATYVYSLQAGTYALTEVRYDASDLIYFAIVDANAALAAGDTDDAIVLYRRAADDPSLAASEAMLNGMNASEESEALRSFARFRIVVANARSGDKAAVEAAGVAAAQAGGPYAALAETFAAAYASSGQLSPACAAVQRAAEQDGSYLDILNSFGYANPTFTAADVCQGTGTVD